MNILKLFPALMALVIVPAWAQGDKFPDRLIRIVVPFSAGGGVDNAARRLGEQLRKQLGAQVIVDNRPGANGTLGAKNVAMSPPDGYTLLFSAATHVLAKQVMSNAPYDPQTEFEPVARVGEAPLVLVIAPKHQQKALSDVLAAAREQPEKWSAGIPAAGAPSHLATLLLAKQGKLRFTVVQYKGTQPALADVAGGHVDLLLDSMISIIPLATSGKVKPIAITSKNRSALMSELPTISESGIPDFSYTSWYGVWAPKGTSTDRITFLNNAINTAVAELANSGAWAKLGIEPVKESADQFKRFIAADVAQGAELLDGAGFKPE